MAAFALCLKWKGSGVATSTFHLKGKGNYDEIAAFPFCLNEKGSGDGMATSPST